jgi:hypothetical protein
VPWAFQVFEETQMLDGHRGHGGGHKGQFDYNVLFQSTKHFATATIISTTDPVSMMSGDRHWDYRDASTSSQMEVMKCEYENENNQDTNNDNPDQDSGGLPTCMWSVTVRLSPSTLPRGSSTSAPWRIYVSALTLIKLMTLTMRVKYYSSTACNVFPRVEVVSSVLLSKF